MRHLQKPINRDLIETILVVLLFMGLLYALYTVLQIFFGVLTFALVFAVSFTKPYGWLVKKLGRRRKLAGVVYALLLILIVGLPLTFLIASMSRHLKDVSGWITLVKTQGLPALPEQIATLPLVGADIADFWAGFRQSPKEAIHLHEHQLDIILRHIINTGLGVLGVALEFILGIIISAFILERGDRLYLPVKDTLRHLAGEAQGDTLLDAINQAIRGVSIGVMGTGFIAAFIAWTGLMLAGIPFATGFAALIFFLVVIQAGALVVWIPLVIWSFIQGDHRTTIILVVYLVIITVVDTIIKPILIAKSGRLPFLVLFLGVIGGLAAWGFTGMFKGAIITAVFYTIFNNWLEAKKVTADVAEG
jgi:predicted PurR-regulated permease PerM